jgi:hypothetical protein
VSDGSGLTRREILAGLGTVGLVAGGPSVARALRGEPPFVAYTVAQSDSGGPDLRVAWYELYNGTREEDSARFTDGATLEGTSESFNRSAAAGEFVDRTGPRRVDAGPAIRLSNVLPGDEGALVVGLVADADVRVWLRVAAPPVDGRSRPLSAGYLENGLREPERAAGDATADAGELQDALAVKFWYDNGSLGGCDGALAASEDLVTLASSLGTAEGTFDEVASGFSSGVALDFGLLDSDCLPANTPRCVSFRWALPPGTGNDAQGDSVAFDVEFGATACDETVNPFGPTASDADGATGTGASGGAR